MAPMDVPAIHSGSIPASCIASYTPAWNAPNAPPPCITSTTWPGSFGGVAVAPAAVDLTFDFCSCLA